jgi:hypothetical protein
MAASRKGRREDYLVSTLLHPRYKTFAFYGTEAASVRAEAERLAKNVYEDNFKPEDTAARRERRGQRATTGMDPDMAFLLGAGTLRIE